MDIDPDEEEEIVNERKEIEFALLQEEVEDFERELVEDTVRRLFYSDSGVPQRGFDEEERVIIQDSVNYSNRETVFDHSVPLPFHIPAEAMPFCVWAFELGYTIGRASMQ